MSQFFRFLLDQPSIAGTVLQHRIDEVTKQSCQSRASYAMKSTQTLNRSIGLYTEDQLRFIQNELRDFNNFFGYVKNDADPENKTPFFTYDSQEADLPNY